MPTTEVQGAATVLHTLQVALQSRSSGGHAMSTTALIVIILIILLLGGGGYGYRAGWGVGPIGGVGLLIVVLVILLLLGVI
jgi:hypothetical protein